MKIETKLDPGQECYFVGSDHIQKGEVLEIRICSDGKIKYDVEYVDLDSENTHDDCIFEDWIFASTEDLCKHYKDFYKMRDGDE